jgi:tetratricopeptide (TPR) repeat protein
VSEGVSDFRAWKLSGALRESLSKTLSTIADMRYEEVADFRAELVRIYEKEFGKYAEPEVEIDDSAEWWFDRGRSFRKLGRETFAELPYNEALNRFRNSPGTEVYQANCIQDLGDVYCKTHRYHEAERSYNEAFAVYRRIPGMEVMQATCRRDLGDVYLKTHRYTKAMRSYRKSLSVFPRMREMEKGQAESKMVLGNICSITYSNEAETIHKEFLAEQRRFMRMDEYKDFAYAEAERCYRKLQVLHRRIAGQEVEQASCKMNLGNVYCRAGRYTEAKRSYLEALEEYRRIPGMELEQATCMRELGEVYCGKHRYTEAERCYHEALGRYRRIPGTEMEQAICRKGLGAIYESTHRYTEAVRSYHDALVEYRRIPGTERWQAHCASNLSVLCFFDLPNYAEARRYAEEALKLCKPFPPKTTKEIRSTCWEILEELNRKIKAAHSATKLSESAFEILNYSLARRMAEWAIKICEPFPSEGTEEIRAACERILQGIKKMDTICSRHILPGH